MPTVTKPATLDVYMVTNFLNRFGTLSHPLKNPISHHGSFVEKTAKLSLPFQFSMFSINGGSQSQAKRKRNSEEKEDFDALMHDLNKPITSFTALLMEDDHPDEHRFPQQIDHIIKSHSDSLQHSLAEANNREYRAVQHQAEEKMRRLDNEITRVARVNKISAERLAHFTFQSQFWKQEVQKMEEMRKELMEAVRIARLRLNSVEEDEESSYVDVENSAGSAWQACRACRTGVGSVMMWPCRHVSVCVTCDATVKACPICLAPKTASNQVFLP